VGNGNVDINNGIVKTGWNSTGVPIARGIPIAAGSVYEADVGWYQTTFQGLEQGTKKGIGVTVTRPPFSSDRLSLTIY
jgi:hypothetical protein